MNIVSGDLFFKKEIKNVYPYVSKNIEIDVCIIGGGISGLLTAYILSKAGSKVSVLEKNIIGFGRTSADIGIIDMDMSKFYLSKSEDELAKLESAYDSARLVLQELLNEIKLDEKNMCVKQIYNTKFMQKSSLEKNAKLKEKRGEICEVSDKIDNVKSCNNIIFGKKILAINVFEFAEKLAELLTKKYNVKIYENTEVCEVNPSYDFVECITNNDFIVKANKLIYCTGADFLKEYNLEDIEIFEKYVIVTSPNDELKNEDRVLYSHNDENRIRILKSGRLIYEGEEVKYTSKMQDENYSKLVEKEKYTKLSVNLNKILTTEEYLIPEYCYKFLFAKTKDRLPIIDEIECANNCFCNISFGENTILSSIVGANMLKNAINGFFTKEMRLFRINRFNCN